MPDIKQISAGGTTYDVYDSAARDHIQDATVHVTAADKSTWSAKENASNKVTSISSASTDTQYPSAKCVYDIVGNIESLLGAML